MIHRYQKQFDGNLAGGAVVAALLYLRVPFSGKIKRIDIWTANNVSGDTVFNLYKSGVAQFSGASRPTISAGQNSASKTGLDIACTRGEILTLDLEQNPAIAAPRPIVLEIEIDDELPVSAFEIAVENGFEGSEAEWLASLQGADGADGANGTNGTDGEDGVGVPPGGTTGQALVKASNDDFDTAWEDQSDGGGGTLAGDVTGNANDNTVEKIHNVPIEALGAVQGFGDDFEDNSLDDSKWEVIAGSPTESSGMLTMPYSGGDSQLRSENSFQLTDGGTVMFELNGTPRFEFYLSNHVSTLTANAFAIISDGFIKGFQYIASAWVVKNSGESHNATTHKYLRFLRSGNTILVQRASTLEGSWTTIATSDDLSSWIDDNLYIHLKTREAQAHSYHQIVSTLGEISLANGTILVFNSANFQFEKYAPEEYRALLNLPVEFGIACSDETTDLETGTEKATLRSPRAFRLTEIRGTLSTASSSGSVEVNVKKNGTTIFSTNITIDATEKTSKTAATPYVLSSTPTDFADDDEITIDIVGAGTGANGLKIWLIGESI